MGCASPSLVNPSHPINSFPQGNLFRSTNNVFNQTVTVKRPNFLNPSELDARRKEILWKII